MKLELNLESNKKTIQIGAGIPYRLVLVSGLEASDYEIYTSVSAQVDGAVITGKRVLPRPIEITGTISSGRGLEDARMRLLSFFNPKHEGTLTVSRGDRQRKIAYQVENFSVSQPTLYAPARFTVALICPAPYFLSLSNYGKNAAKVTPQFAFPLGIPKGKGKIMGYRDLPRSVKINNDGDIETGIEIRFTAQHGSVKNPVITKTETGEFMRVMAELSRGDVLSVNTNVGTKRILLNGESAFHMIDRASTFFQISSGINTMMYDAGENYVNLDVWLYFTPKYLGV